MYCGSEKHLENYKKAAELGRQAQQLKKQEQIKSYNTNPKKCLQCDDAIPYSRPSVIAKTKFCSSKCAGLYNGKNKNYTHSEKTKQKISRSVKKYILQATPKLTSLNKIKKCGNSTCGKNFYAVKKKTIFCSGKCAVTYRMANLTPEERLQMSEKGKINIRKQAEEGKWKGWSGRGEASFPEKYITSLLEKDGYKKDEDYIFNMPCCGYFIDFAFKNVKIAFEVDGKQHEYPEHKARDERKEEAIMVEGWLTLRLKWKSIKTKHGKEFVDQQYKDIMNIIQKYETLFILPPPCRV